MGNNEKPGQSGLDESITGHEDTLQMPVLGIDKSGNPVTVITRGDTNPRQSALDEGPTPTQIPDAVHEPAAKTTSHFEPVDIMTLGDKPRQKPEKASNALRITFTKKSRESLFQKLGLEQPKQTLEIPPERAATYLTIDAETINNTKNHTFLASEIKIIAESREFPTIQDNDGNLIIIALSERGGVEKLFDIEESLRKAIPTARMILGSCNIQNCSDETFIFTDEHLEKQTLQECPPDTITRISKALASKIDDPESRVGSNLHLSAEEIDNTLLVRLIKAASIVSKEIGGPDKFIGYEVEFDALYKFATDDETRIISLEGAAGMGKSRLRTELLKKLPAHILCSANTSDSSLPGASLVTLAGRLIEITTEALNQQDTQEALDTTMLYSEAGSDEECESISLNQFQELSHAKRIEFASRQPEIVAELCFEAMSKLREQKDPKTIFIFEDLHHVDHISEPHIIKLLQKYSQTQEGQPPGKVLVTSRPEEMYQSINFKELKSNPATKGTIRIIPIKGLELFMNDRLGYDFAYHSLPPKLREGRRLGNWYEILARKANKSPWAMKTFMDEVKTCDQASNSYQNLIITNDNTIELKPEVLSRIEDIQNETDMATYFQERLARLDEKPRKFLQYIALMDEDLHIGQIMTIFRDLLKSDLPEMRKIASELGSGGYTSEDKLHGQLCKLQHEGTKTIVLNSIPDQETKVTMAKELYNLFREDETLNPKTRHNLASIIASSIPATASLDLDQNQGEFWSDYEQLSAALFADAEYNHHTEASYELASTILNLPMVQACITNLQAGDSHIFVIRELAIKALFNHAESTTVMGKFDETDKAIQALQNIHAHFPEMVDIIKLYLMAFDKAHMQNRKAGMKAAFEAIQKCNKPTPKSTQIRMEIIIADCEHRFDDIVKIYRENKAILKEEAEHYAKTHGAPSQTYLDLQRICEIIAPFEQIRRLDSKVGGQEFDYDITMQPGAYTADNLNQIKAMADRLDEINHSMRSHPLGLNPQAAIKALENKATLKACLGQYEAAIKLFSEVWRIANQLQLNDQAARVAKIKSDVQVIQALLTNNGRIELLKKATQTLSEEGIEKSLSRVDESSDYQAILRFERIRAVGILTAELLESAKDEPPPTQELKPYIAAAMEDFNYINKKWASWAKLPIVQYYVMGYMGHILSGANQAGIKIEEMIEAGTNLFDSKQYPFMNLQFGESGLKYGDGMIDLDFGEVQRKLDGLQLLAKALRRLEHSKAQIKRAERDSALAERKDSIRMPRARTVLRTIGFDTDEAIVDEMDQYTPEFTESAQNLKRLALEISQEPPSNKESIAEKIAEACRIFTQANQQWPELATNPETIYHMTSYIGLIAQIAYRNGLPIDENIFDEQSHPYIKLAEVKKAYEYAKRISDSQGETARKSDSLSALIAILETKNHNKKRQDRKEKDRAILMERREMPQQTA